MAKLTDKRVPLAKGDEPTRRARSALVQRAAKIDVDTLPALPKCAEAARFWSERAWSELAAVPAMSQIQLALLRDDALSTDALGAFAQIGADEVRHTELSRDVAEKLGGYIEVIPAGAAWEPARLGDASTMPLAFWVVASGCISETISLALMNARLPHTTNATAKAVLSAVIKDEAVHQRVGWNLAERVLPHANAALKKELAEYAHAMFDVIGVTFATAGLRGKARSDARKLREVTAHKGLGAAPPDEEDAVCLECINTVIAPRLVELGLPLG